MPDLRAAYIAAGADTTYVARAAVARRAGPARSGRTRPLLDEALKDKDWAVRVRAADLLKEQNVTDGIATAMRPATAGEPVDAPAWMAIVAPPFSPHAFIETDKGVIEIELAVLDAPLTVRNFMSLARKGFFNGVAFHRIVPDFVVQGGDPRGDGEGGPGLLNPRRVEPAALPARHGRHGARLARHWRQPVLHHPLAGAAPRRALHRLRSRGGGDGGGRPHPPWDVIRRVRSATA